VFICSRLRLYPTEAQEKQLLEWEGHTRWLWNRLLALNIEKYENEKKFVFRYEMSKLLTGLKEEHEWLRECSSYALQHVCLDLDAALRRSFKSQKNRGGFPKWKRKWRRSFGFYSPYANFSDVSPFVQLPKLGSIRYRGRLHVSGRAVGHVVKRTPDGRWHLVTKFEVSDVPSVSSGEVLGIDVGLLDLATTSEGEIFDNRRFYRQDEGKIKRLSRRHSKKTDGSNRRDRARRALARAHAKIKNRRDHHLHQITSAIAKRTDVGTVVVEDLNIEGMKKRLGKSFSDAALNRFISALEYKCALFGKRFARADRFFPSSQICSSCGHSWGKLTLDVREVTCSECGTHHDRDTNAAVNLKNYVAVERAETLNGRGDRISV